MSDTQSHLLRRAFHWCRLIRLPNVFSAPGDVLLGFWLVGLSVRGSEGRLGLLIVASCSLYVAGMIWNDVFDLPIDSRERAGRPLPSGAISVASAIRAAVVLLLVGVAAAAGAGLASGLVALLLAAAILAYDGLLKRTAAGPLAMGLCRLLNVLLGMSAGFAGFELAEPASPLLWVVPVGIGVYVTGVTWFARHEAGVSPRRSLAFAAAVIASGLAIELLVMLAVPGVNALAWPVAAAFILVVARPVGIALADPSPKPVQRAVKTAVLGLIALDAALVLAFRGPVEALVVFSLLVPALLLGRWMYST